MGKIYKITGFTLALFMVLLLSVLFFEPSLSGAATDSDTIVVTLIVTEGIALSSGADVSMAPNISISADSSIGASSWTVTTNAIAGYTLGVKATSSPALVNTATSTVSFADYSEAVAGTPDTWSVDSGNYEFGFSGYGTDVEAEHKGSASSCGAGGTPDANLLFEGLATTTDEVLATRATVTPYVGVVTNICFGAEQNTIFAPSGTYQATVVATATTL